MEWQLLAADCLSLISTARASGELKTLSACRNSNRYRRMNHLDVQSQAVLQP